MSARRLSLLGVALSLFLSGCVVEQRDFLALRDQVRLQQKQINDLKSRQDEMSLRSDALNNGFKILGDKAEENARRIDAVGEEAAQSTRLGSAPAPEAPSAPPVAAAPLVVEGPILLTNLPKPAPPEPPEPPPGGEFITAGPRPEKLYAGALAQYSGRNYQQATSQFKEFVAAYPDHKLAGNAQYWIGECYYSQKKFTEAAEEFAAVEKTYPSSHKVPAALLKKGLSLAELRQMPEARAALQRIVERYGQSEEAAKAKERLERWKQP